MRLLPSRVSPRLESFDLKHIKQEERAGVAATPLIFFVTGALLNLCTLEFGVNSMGCYYQNNKTAETKYTKQEAVSTILESNHT